MAGAICGINFSNQVTATGTLNINSTGSKNYVTYSWDTKGALGAHTAVTYSYCRYILAIYTGSNYIFPSTYERSGIYYDD